MTKLTAELISDSRSMKSPRGRYTLEKRYNDFEKKFLCLTLFL